MGLFDKAKQSVQGQEQYNQQVKSTLTPSPVVPKAPVVPAVTPGSKKEKEEQRKAMVKNSWLENYNLSLPGIGRAYAQANPQIAQNAVYETNMFINEKLDNPMERFAFGAFDKINPAGSALNNLERTVGDIDTEKLDKSIAYQAGNMAGYMGQYALSGGLGIESAVFNGMKALPRVAGMGKIASPLLRGVTSNAVGGLPINVTTSLDESVQDGKVDGGQFAKSMAINTAIDTVLGGAVEGISALARLRRYSKAKQDEVIEKVAKEVGMTDLEKKAFESNVRKGKITPDGDTLYGNAPQPIAGELPAPSRTYQNKTAPTTKVPKLVDKPGVDKIKAKSDVYKEIKTATGVKDPEDAKRIADIIKTLDTDVKDGWDTPEFWKEIIDVTKNQEYDRVDPEKLYPGLKKEIRETPIKITGDLKQITDFNALRKKSMGKVKLSKNGKPMDELYMEWNERYPDLFPESITHPTDQLETLIKVSDSLKPTIKRVGDVMSDDDLWDGPLMDVWKAVNKYQTTVKETAFDGLPKKYNNPVNKIKPDIYARAKGQREVPRTVNPLEVSQKASNEAVQPPKAESRPVAPPKKETPKIEQKMEVKNAESKRDTVPTKTRKLDPKTERVLEKLNNRLRERGEDGENFYEVIDHPRQKEIDVLADLFKAKVVTVKPLKETADTFHGVYVDDTIVINLSKTSNPAHVIFGHEVLHQVRAKHSAEYDRFAKVFAKSLDESKVKRYKESLEQAEGKMTDDAMLEEMIADFSGEMFNDPKIMRRIFEEDRTVAQWIHDIITGMITKIKDSYVLSTSLKDLKAVQDEYVKLMREARLKDARPDKPGMKFSTRSEKAMPSEKIMLNRLKTDDKLDGYNSKKEVLENAEKLLLFVKEKEHQISLSEYLSYAGLQGTGGKISRIGNLGEIRTVAKAITTDLINYGKVDLRGKRVETSKDLALICQVYRDPRFETIRYFYAKEGVVVGHEGVTCKIPGMSRVAPGNYKEDPKVHYKYFDEIKDRMKKLGADSIYVVHNHPSGNPEPSLEDINVTTAMADIFGDAFSGHVVIDSNKYAFISKYGITSTHDLNLGEDLVLKPSIAHTANGKKVNSPDLLADLAKQLQVSEDVSSLVYVDAKLNVRALQEVPNNSILNGDKSIEQYISEKLVDFGSTKAFLIYSKKDKAFLGRVDDMMRSGHTLDAVDIDTGYSHRANGSYPLKEVPDGVNTHIAESVDVKFSTKRDSDGKLLTKEQDTFYKNSKIRDEDGNLLKVYHGTEAEFTVFDRNKGRANMDIQGSFFSPWELDSKGYGKNVKPYYLNITNPASESEAYKALNRFKGQDYAGKKATEYLMSKGYDGVRGDDELIAFYPEQIKSIDNLNPTTDPDIRFSLKRGTDADNIKGKTAKGVSMKDSVGKALTEEQAEFFKDSKVRDAEGKLLQLYHGSFGVGKFFEFNTDTIFLTTDSFVASKYSSAERIGKENVHYYSVYADLKNPLVVEASKRIEGKYDVTIKSNPYTGKNTIELSQNGETVKTITTYNPDDFAKWFGENKATQFLNGISKAKQTKDAWGNKYHKYSAKGVQTKYSYPSAHDAIEWNGSKYTADELAKEAKAKGYDGVIINNVIDDLSFSETGTSATNVIAFRSNQVKLTTNLNPTTDPDIRFSKKRGMDDGNARLEAERKMQSAEKKVKEIYDENVKEIADAEVGETGAWFHAKSITDKGVGRHLEITRLADYAFKKSEEGRKWFRENFENDFFKSKGKFTDSIFEQTDTLYNEVVKKYGIWKGSKESAGMQQIGEGMKLVKDGKEWKAVEYTLDDLKKDFDYTMKNGKKAWENIVEAEKVTRKMYDDYIDRINGALKEIYPNVEANVEDIYRRAMKAKLETGNVVHSISRGNQGVVQKVDGDSVTVHFKNQETGKEATVVMDRKDLMNQKHKQELEDATVGKRLFARQNYYRHFSEMQGSFLVGLDNIINGATNIDPRLIDVSRGTQPNSKWSGFLQHRGKGTDYMEDAVGGMLEYIPQAEYKINIEPNIPKLRKIIKELQESTIDSKNANGFIDNLMQIANDLAGKTNPIDRVWGDVLGDAKGRMVLNGLSKVSNRVRANAVMGNMNTMIAQFFNFPNVVAYTMQNAKGTGGKGIVEGIEDAIKAYGGNREAQEILNKSMFLKERYIDRKYRRFDRGISASTDKLFSWTMELGDKIVADGAFLTFYRQNIAKGMDEMEAVLKADELTRKSIGGRGIAEMPLSQKAKTTKLFAPFQVEVRNSISVLKELGISKDPYALAGIFVGMFGTSMLMNLILEKTTGREIGLNPYGMIMNAVKDEDAKSIPYRLVGNFVTNYPGGSYIADVLKNTLDMDDYNMQKMFGDQDPSRFGTGNMALQTLGKPVGTALKQLNNPDNTETNIDLLQTASMVLPKYGGKQIERTVRGLQDMALLPKEKLNVNSGASLEKRKLPASYTATGKMRFPIEKTPLNYALAPTLGVYATKQGKDYITKDRRYLGEKDTAKIEQSKEPIKAYDKLIYDRDIKRIKTEIKDIKKNDEYSDAKKNKKIVEQLREQIKVIKDSGHLSEQQKRQEVLRLQGEILKYK